MAEHPLPKFHPWLVWLLVGLILLVGLATRSGNPAAAQGSGDATPTPIYSLSYQRGLKGLIAGHYDAAITFFTQFHPAVNAAGCLSRAYHADCRCWRERIAS